LQRLTQRAVSRFVIREMALRPAKPGFPNE
jgi:hypothetical protein